MCPDRTSRLAGRRRVPGGRRGPPALLGGLLLPLCLGLLLGLLVGLLGWAWFGLPLLAKKRADGKPG